MIGIKIKCRNPEVVKEAIKQRTTEIKDSITAKFIALSRGEIAAVCTELLMGVKNTIYDPSHANLESDTLLTNLQDVVDIDVSNGQVIYTFPETMTITNRVREIFNLGMKNVMLKMGLKSNA